MNGPVSRGFRGFYVWCPRPGLRRWSSGRRPRSHPRRVRVPDVTVRPRLPATHRDGRRGPGRLRCPSRAGRSRSRPAGGCHLSDSPSRMGHQLTPNPKRAASISPWRDRMPETMGVFLTPPPLSRCRRAMRQIGRRRRDARRWRADRRSAMRAWEGWCSWMRPLGEVMFQVDVSWSEFPSPPFSWRDRCRLRATRGTGASWAYR